MAHHQMQKPYFLFNFNYNFYSVCCFEIILPMLFPCGLTDLMLALGIIILIFVLLKLCRQNKIPQLPPHLF